MTIKQMKTKCLSGLYFSQPVHLFKRCISLFIPGPLDQENYLFNDTNYLICHSGNADKQHKHGEHWARHWGHEQAQDVLSNAHWHPQWWIYMENSWCYGASGSYYYPRFKVTELPNLKSMLNWKISRSVFISKLT
jgi:hypothetical protein